MVHLNFIIAVNRWFESNAGRHGLSCCSRAVLPPSTPLECWQHGRETGVYVRFAKT